jgi:hypothetical protein
VVQSILGEEHDPHARERRALDNWSWELAVALLPPVLTAVLAGGGFWISERLKDRDTAQQRLKAISEESARVQYLRSWLKTYSLVPGMELERVDGARQNVGRDLIDSHARLAQALQQHPNGDSPSVASRAWKRAFLVPLERPAARVVRWGYWLFVVLAIVLTLAFMTSGYETADGTQPTFLTVFASGLILFVPFFAIAMIFQAWSTRLELRYHRATRGKSVTQKYGEESRASVRIQPQEFRAPVRYPLYGPAQRNGMLQQE